MSKINSRSCPFTGCGGLLLAELPLVLLVTSIRKTLGVGYHNITEALSGTLPVAVLVSLCFWKFVSWAIALGSGTSGGTLAPLLTIGSAVGCLLGIFVQNYFPETHISLPLAALVGMAALFAGASRAILTSIVFAMETTMQESTLLPLIAGCSTAYLVSFVLMRSTIMTEKIKRRGVQMPESYRPDMLELRRVFEIMSPIESTLLTINEDLSVRDIREMVSKEGLEYEGRSILVVSDTELLGFVDKKALLQEPNSNRKVSELINGKCYAVYSDKALTMALELMLRKKQHILAVIDRQSKKMTGVVTERDILAVFEQRFIEDKLIHQHISLTQKARQAAGRLTGKRS